jgi:hypothetical protein
MSNDTDLAKAQRDVTGATPRGSAEAALKAIPPGIARDWVRSLMGFGVGVAIGVAPLIGKLPIPGFAALLSLFPLAMQGWLIPLSAFLMGLSSVAITFYAALLTKAGELRKYFARTLIVALCAFVSLLVVYIFTVAHVDVPALQKEVAFVVGPTKCGPCVGLSDAECISRLTFNPASIAGCYGDRAIATANLLLSLSYLTLLSCFGVLVGIVNMAQALKRARR